MIILRFGRFIRQNGFTVIEVLVAMLIVSMALLLLLNIAMVALEGNDWSDESTTATQLIQEKLEQLRTTRNPVAGTDTIQGIKRTWTVTNAGDHLRRVDITVEWEDMRAQTRANSVSTFIRTDST